MTKVPPQQWQTASRNAAKKYTLGISGGPNYTFSSNSLQTTGNFNYPGFRGNANGTLYLPGKFQIASDIIFTYQGATGGQPAVYTKMWNGSINKTFFKDDNLKLSLTGNNLLNQDQYSRTINAAGLTINNYNTIKRFFMFIVTWDFTKFGTIPAKN